MAKNIWGRFSQMLGLEVQGQESGHNELHIVTAALMIHVALEHEGLSDVEKQNIFKNIEMHFDLSAQDAQRIFELAVIRHEQAADLYSLTRGIMKVSDQEGQQEIVRLLYRVAFADDNLEHYEEQIISRIAGLLGVDARDRVRIKQLEFSALTHSAF